MASRASPDDAPASAGHRGHGAAADGPSLSNLLLPRSHYQPGAQISFRDGDTYYSARLGQVFEDHERWLRVNMDILGSEPIEAAA